MNSLFFQQSFESLSLKDLLKARDIYHYQLISKQNVVATAIGLYRIRKSDPWHKYGQEGKATTKIPKKTDSRTLANSEIRPYSWPCIYVFVSDWELETDLAKNDPGSIVPKTLILDDGRSVPVCVIEAKKQDIDTDLQIKGSQLSPENYMAPGSFIINPDGQGVKRVATAGAIVKDSQRYYLLTANHALGAPKSPIYGSTSQTNKKIGSTAQKNIGRKLMQEVYPAFECSNQYLQMDIGLIELDNILDWKTTTPGLAGNYCNVIDLYDQNFTLKLIGQIVTGKGAISGIVRGEIQALFYRYKSISGYEYLSDFLIGPVTENADDKEKQQQAFTVHHGDSGMLLYIEQPGQKKSDKPNYYPLAVLWGKNSFESANNKVDPFAMATALSTVMNQLELDYVADLNVNDDFTWGYIGHYAIGRQLSDAVGLIKNNALKNFISLNADKISMSALDIRNVADSPRAVENGSDPQHPLFVPLADVPDNVWKSNVNFYMVDKKRVQGPGSRNQNDNPNHFADIDLSMAETNDPTLKNKTLLQLSLQDPVKYLDPDFWVSFYNAPYINNLYNKWKKDQMQPGVVFHADPKGKHWGALPFRVWQIYDQMVESAKNGKADEFLCAGGVLVHYVGDACQPLHTSYMSQGDPNDLVPYTNTKGVTFNKMRADNVHSGYEDDMVNAKDSIKQIMDELPGAINSQSDSIPTITNGFEAAKALMSLIDKTRQTLLPETIIHEWIAVKSDKKADRNQEMWDTLGPQTIQCMARGCRYLAAIWESAWKTAGNKIPLVEVPQEDLIALYGGSAFLPSIPLNKYKAILK